MNRTKREKESKPLWQTWWSVVGPRLPQSEFRFQDNVVLARLSDEEFGRMKAHRAPVPTITPPGDTSVISYPPRDEVQSRYKLQIDVNALDQDEASRLALAIADRLAFSLSLAVNGGNFHVELRKLRRLGDSVEYSAYSQSVRVSIYNEPTQLLDDDIRKSIILFNASGADSTAGISYVHLLSAWQLQMTSGSKPLERSILQHYVLCIEAIVNGVMSQIRKDRKDKIRLEERNYAAEFAETLIKRADKPEAIREASTKLREISLSNMVPSINIVSDLLNLSESIKSDSIELYKFRSRNLSHPGRSSSSESRKWLHSEPGIANICLADSLARSFITSYCEYISRKC